MKTRSSGILLDAVQLPPDSSIFQQFTTRATGLDSNHTAAYRGLLNGLTTDGLFNSDGTSSIFDCLYILATSTSTISLLNVVTNNFNAVSNGGPTFTVDRGFTGVDSSTTVYLDTGFNPTTALAPKFSLNSGHISAWSSTNAASGVNGGCIIGVNLAANDAVRLFPEYNDGNCYGDINTAVNSMLVANANSTGHYIANRSASNALQLYRNASSIQTAVTAAAAIPNGSIVILAIRNGVTPPTGFGGGYQIAMASIGASMTATQVTNFYNRLRAYMTAVGVP